MASAVKRTRLGAVIPGLGAAATLWLGAVAPSAANVVRRPPPKSRQDVW